MYYWKMKYKFDMGPWITSEKSRLTASLFNSEPALGVVCTFFVPLNWSDCIRTLHNISVKSGSKRRVCLICNIKLVHQLRILYVCVLFCILDNLAVLLVVGTSLLDRSIEGIFPMGFFIVFIRSCPGITLSKYTPISDLQDVLQTDSDIECNKNDHRENKDSTKLFRSWNVSQLNRIEKRLDQLQPPALDSSTWYCPQVKAAIEWSVQPQGS